jgi:hypothetical protein
MFYLSNPFSIKFVFLRTIALALKLLLQPGFHISATLKVISLSRVKKFLVGIECIQSKFYCWILYKGQVLTLPSDLGTVEEKEREIA